MNWFYNLRTARKLALGFGLCLTLAVIVGMVAISRMTEMNKVTEDILSDCVGGYDALSRFQGAANAVRTIEYRHVLSVTPADKSSAEVDISNSEGDAQKALKVFKTSLTTPADNRNYQTLQNAWQQYDSAKTTVFALSRKDQVTACASLMNGPLKDQFRQVTDQISLLMSRNRMHAEDDRKRAEAAINSGRAIVIGLLSLSIILGALFAVFITRYMTGTLNLVSARLEQLRSQCITDFADAIQALEHGDLTAEIVSQTEALPIHTQDELGQMAGTFNAMLDQVNGTIDSFRKSQASLRELVLNLQSSAALVASASVTLTSTSQKVGAASEEITATMQEVSLSSEQSAKGASEIAQGGAAQAAALSQGSALVKQLSEAVHGVAQDSEAATQAADDATQAAREGALTVGQSVESMQNIHRTVSDSAKAIATLGEASRQIGGIVQTIDEIAEQTNLLALNAAIEAARAGDAGRGFAVVADEVRKLAERSGAATREISGLIGDVQSRTGQAVAAMQAGTQEVQNGRALAEQAGMALARIQNVVGTVTARIEGIRAATMQMTSASDEVSSAITEVAAVVEQSSAAAEQMSAAAEQVSASVQTVAGTVAQQSGAVEELVASSESLSDISRSMEAATAQFRVFAPQAQEDEPQLHLLRAA